MDLKLKVISARNKFLFLGTDVQEMCSCAALDTTKIFLKKEVNLVKPI